MSSKNSMSLPSADAEMNKISPKGIKYPTLPRKLDASYNYNGIEISNNYEYLEDSNHEETRKFIKDQNVLFDSFISQSPSRPMMKKKLQDIWNYTQTGVPIKRGNADRIFYWEANGTQNHSALYVKESMDGKPRKLLDPNFFDKDGVFSIKTVSISNDGKYVAYAMSENGSDWQVIKVRDVGCGHDRDDSLRYIKLTSIGWTQDSKGFFYQRYPRPLNGAGQATGTETSVNRDAKLYYHTVGTMQDNDFLAVEFLDNPTWNFYAELSDKGEYLFVQASDVIGEKYLYYANLKGGFTRNKLNLIRVFDEPGTHWYLANDDTIVYFMTSVGAKTSNHVVRLNLANSGKVKPEVVVQDQGKKVYWAIVVNQNKLVTCYVQDVLCQIEIRDLFSGNVLEKQLSIEPGTASEKFGRRTDPEFYFKMESYINPGTLYKVTFGDKGKIKMKILREAFHKLDLNAFQMSPLSYSSNDGTNIPVFLIHKKDMVPDSNRPCLYTAYGGYGTMKLPEFKNFAVAFVHHFNGVVAVANIRGGSEYGGSWWNEGRLLNKQNGFDDFIAGARFLLHNGFTKPEKLAINGISNGGLLIGAVVNQRPDLFGAAIPQFGIMDMMRYHKFTVGPLWVGEFGNPEDEQYTSYLKSYSPLHNVRARSSGQYPAIMVTAADHDDRVVPSHSYKYVAELQNMANYNSQQTNPLLMKIYHNSGHVAGKSFSQEIQEWADIFSFLQLTLDYEFKN